MISHRLDAAPYCQIAGLVVGEKAEKKGGRRTVSLGTLCNPVYCGERHDKENRDAYVVPDRCLNRGAKRFNILQVPFPGLWQSSPDDCEYD